MQELLTSWWTWSSMIADWLLLLKQSNVAVLCNFLVNTSHQVMPRISLPSIHTIYGMTLSKIMMMKSWQKRKVIAFLKPFHIVKNAKDIFFFQVREDQSSVMEGMQICLPTTCKLLEIPRCFGQAVSSFVAQRGSCYKGSVNCNRIKVSWK